MWPWRSWLAAIASSEATRSSSRLADADQDAAGEGNAKLARGLDRGEAPGRVLGRRSGVHGLHQPLGDRLQHQTLRGRHLAQPAEVFGREHSEVGVGQDAPLERPLAGPGDVGGEVLVAPRAQPPGDLGVDLGSLAGEDQQLLGVPAPGLLEPPLDLIRVVDVGLMRREGAVLAEALAGPRERERVVAREGDALHPIRKLADARPSPVPAPRFSSVTAPRSGAWIGGRGRCRRGIESGGSPA